MKGLIKTISREERLQYVSGDLRIFLETPDRVFVPLFPEGHIDAEAVAVPQNLFAELGTHTQKHLELVIPSRYFLVLNHAVSGIDELCVVGRDADIGMSVEHQFKYADEVLVDLAFVLEAD